MNQLLIQPLPDISRGNVFAILTGERGIVHLESHADGGFVNTQWHHRFRLVRATDGVGNVQFVDTGDADDIARFGLLHLKSLQTAITHHL